MVNRREFLAAAVATPGITKLATAIGPTDSNGAFKTQPSALPPGSIKVGGEMGRRIDVTLSNNLLAIDVDIDFLKPLRERKKDSGYTGLGKLIDASVASAFIAEIRAPSL